MLGDPPCQELRRRAAGRCWRLGPLPALPLVARGKWAAPVCCKALCPNPRGATNPGAPQHETHHCSSSTVPGVLDCDVHEREVLARADDEAVLHVACIEIDDLPCHARHGRWQGGGAAGWGVQVRAPAALGAPLHRWPTCDSEGRSAISRCRWPSPMLPLVIARLANGLGPPLPRLLQPAYGVRTRWGPWKSDVTVRLRASRYGSSGQSFAASRTSVSRTMRETVGSLIAEASCSPVVTCAVTPPPNACAGAASPAALHAAPQASSAMSVSSRLMETTVSYHGCAAAAGTGPGLGRRHDGPGSSRGVRSSLYCNFRAT
jgi:hypothetical protein